MSCERWHDQIQAYADDSLPMETATELETHLRECPACALEALALERGKRWTRMHAMRFTPSAEFQDQMAAMIRGSKIEAAEEGRKDQQPALTSIAAATQGRSIRIKEFWQAPQWAALAAVLLIGVLMAVTAWLWTQHETTRQAWAEMVDMHVATLASANPVDVVSTDRHTVKPWFAGKLPFTFNLPELQNSNYRLVGGKLVYLDGAPAAQLVYAVAKHEISVFVFEQRSTGIFGKSFPGTGVATRQNKGFTTEGWSGTGLSYVVVSDAGASDVHGLGEMLRTAARP